MGAVTIVLRDFDGDRQQSTVYMADTLASANFDANEAIYESYVAAVQDVTLGNLARQSWLARTDDTNDTNAAVPAAQVNIRWVVQCTDNVDSSKFKIFIPTADITNADLFLPASNQHDPAAAEWIALKAALANMRSPTNHAFTIDAIYYEE